MRLNISLVIVSIILIIVAIGLAACGGSIPVIQQPSPVVVVSSDIWRMTPDTWAEYQWSKFTGHVDPATDVISVDPGSEVVLQCCERITNLATMMLDGSPATARVYGPGGVIVTTVPAVLAGTLVERGEGRLIGEAANSYAKLIDPPEPLLVVPLLPGEVVNTTHRVTYWGGTTGTLATRYRTQADDTALGFPGAVVTTLIENPGTPGAIDYTQVFDGEVVVILYGPAGGTSFEALRRVRVGP